jgi:hypothetical protein
LPAKLRVAVTRTANRCGATFVRRRRGRTRTVTAGLVVFFTRTV